MQWSVKIEIDVQKPDFSKAKQEVSKFARDTGKALDPIKRTKLEMDVANATLNLQKLRNEMKNFQWTLSQKKQLIIDTNNAQSQLTEAKKKLQNFLNTGDENLSRLQKKFNWIGWAISTAKIAIWSFLWSLASSLFTSAVNWIKNFAESIVTLWARLEQTKIAFTTMLWSAEEADALLRDLTDFASKTPFEINWIRDTAKQLLAFWFTSKEIIPTLKSLWDVSAGLSVPIEQVAYAYGQVRVANQLYWTELRQFTNAWVPLLAELAKMFWVTETAVKKMVEQGKVWFKDVEKAFQNMSWEWWKFENLMDKQSKTVSWAWSNFKDILTKTAEAMWIQLMPTIARAIDWLAKMTASLWDTLTWANNFTFGIWELSEALAENKKEQEELEKSYKDWAISMVEYNRKAEQLKIEEEDLKESLENTKMSSDDLTKALDDLDSLKLSTDQKVTELRKIQTQAQESAYALDKLIHKLEDTRLWLSKMVAKEKKETESWNRSLIWAGWLMTTSQAQLNLVDLQLQAKKQEADKINKTISEIDKKLWGWTKTAWVWGGGWWWKSWTSALEKKVKEDMSAIDDKIKASEAKRKDYQKEIENTQKKIKELRDSAVDDIEEINRQLKELEWKWNEELAKRYAEVIEELAWDNLDDTERNKLAEEKLFLEQKVSEELRNQAVEYSKLSEAQKIYKDNEKEIDDLTEKKKIAQAFLAWNLTTTAEWWIGMKDENDPSKIIAITNLKNQQYALDLVNKQQTYELDLQAQEKKAQDELEILTDLQKEKLALEQQYTRLFWDEVEKQKSIIDWLMKKLRELIDLQQRAWMGWWGGGSTTTNNQTNNINVSNNVDVKKVTQVLTKTTR